MIKGWTEKEPYQFIRAGKIRIGEKSEKGAPRKLDYFIVPPEVAEVYGEKPKVLDIVLPDEENFMTAKLMRWDGGNNLICQSDGINATVSVDRLKYKPQEYNARVNENGVLIYGKKVETSGTKKLWAHFRCPYQECIHYQNGHCTETVYLYVCLTKIKGSVLRVYTLTTRSYNTFHHIKKGAEELKKRFGRCSFIPVQMRIKVMKRNVPGKGNMATEVPILYLDFEDSFEEVWERAMAGKLIWSFAPDNLPNASMFLSNKNTVKETSKFDFKNIANINSDETNDEIEDNENNKITNHTSNNSNSTGQSNNNDDSVLENALKNLESLSRSNIKEKDIQAGHTVNNIEVVIIRKPRLRQANDNKKVACVEIAFPDTRELGLLWARGELVEKLLELNERDRLKVRLVPIRGRRMEFELMRMYEKNVSYSSFAGAGAS